MNKYKSYLVLLGLFCAVLVGLSFMIAGTPVSQQAVSLDQIRLNNFNEINTIIQDYYLQNHVLPTSLNELKFNKNTRDQLLLDPETKKPYEYIPDSNTLTYKFCTNFSTDSATTPNDVYSVYPDADLSHGKGHDCVSYKLPAYILTPTPTPFIAR